VKTGKLVGTVAWLMHVQTTGVFTIPMEQLLHYPVPKKPIPAFTEEVFKSVLWLPSLLLTTGSQEITITNYTGAAREYLKRMIQVMGGKFTASMSSKNTVLIAA
jgi:mediator of DNA damage checkpoint protein 1